MTEIYDAQKHYYDIVSDMYPGWPILDPTLG